MQGVLPNPMPAGGRIHFSLDQGQAQLVVRIFDVTGRLVRDFGQFEVGPGDHHIHWDGGSDTGNLVQSGMYFSRIAGNNDIRGTTKVLVVR